MSPCIRVCRLDENQVCMGCNRTIDQIKQAGLKMLTHEELDRDPWSTYPVTKQELRELIDLRDYLNRYDDKDEHHIHIHSVDENADGSADIEFTLGREAARLLIREGLLAVLKRAVDES